MAVLGDRLQYVIVKGQEEGVESIEYLKRQASGRGSFIPLQLSRKQVKPLPLDEAEVVAPLLEMVAVKEGYRDVAEYLLADVVVVKDLMAGIALWNRNGFYCTLVTLAGEVIDSMGVVTGGSDASLDRGIFTQRRRIKELAIIVQALEEQLTAEDRALSGLKEELAEAETKKKLLGGEIHRLELERVRLEHECRSADQECQRLTQAAEALGREQRELTKDLELLDGEIRRCRESAEARLQEKTARERFFTEKQSAAADLKNAAETLEAAVTQSRIRHAALSEKRENTHLNLDNRLKLQAECAAEAAGRRGQIEDILQRRAEIDQALGESQRALEQGRAALNEMASRLQAERQGYRNISMKLAEIEESIKELRPLGESYQEERSRAQLALAEKRMSLQHLAENIREKYDVGLLETLASGPSRAELQAEIDDLRGRLERMGEVNLAAIGEYEELTTRFQFMSRQKEDLEKSIADLQQTIVKLNRVCRLRFKESFEQINEKFEIIFPRLFSGGKARLVLTDENDYLETGVDIIVQPPGKKLQSITLLSGGEKALTAVSLLFAIFLTKPSPFCFLDEVDAPLDDANLDRFNDMIKEMSEFSQFVLVTHNKKTMQAAEMLYGITMAEPGVSKLVSVRMS
jgi:chromosome segregation protein